MQATEELMMRATVTFVELLRQRLAAKVFTTEDSVRYTFLAQNKRSCHQGQGSLIDGHSRC